MTFILFLTPVWLPGKETVVKMAVKRGQKLVNPANLPLACITFVLENAALPIGDVSFYNTETKDKWLAKVGSIDVTHPHVLTAMQGDHRSLVMLIVHLQPGRYSIGSINFEGRYGIQFWTIPGKEFYFEVKPNCVNFVGSLVINADWQAISVATKKFPTAMVVEQTASRDKKWATDVVPGLAGFPAEESLIEVAETESSATPNGKR